ncbi:hypothetical protein ACFSQT_33000 [Mesorhizobium calcicola]|uniref:Uncharacterized protein n=1 Tax=Mesorhizobium calcicola TaxID=1300310 RepID=A0ABW4WMF4_9HYPH
MALLSVQPFGWQALNAAPGGSFWLPPVSAAVLGQILMTSAYRHAEALGRGALRIHLDESLGRSSSCIIVFGRRRHAQHACRAALIVVAAGIFIIWRERQLGLERTAQERRRRRQG